MEIARRQWPIRVTGARIDLLFTMSDNTDTGGNAALVRIAFPTNECCLCSQSHTIDYAWPIAWPSGGARRDRTDDLLLAKQALSQLSYGPVPVEIKPNRLSAFAEASADNLRGSKAGVPTKAALAAKVGGPGKT